MLTEKELKQIKDYLALYGKKDSQLNNVGEYTPSSEDYLAIVKNGNNVTVTIEQLENTFLKTFLDDPAFEETWQGAIDTPKLADGAITTEKLADLAVIAQKILDSAVTTAKIAPQAVTTDKIQDGAVTEGKIANYEVTETKLATGAVTSSKIYEGAVTEDKIALGAVTNSKIATGTISGAKFVDNSISGSKIQDNSVPGSKIKDGTIENVDIKDNSLSGAKLIDNSISGTKIATNAIESRHLQDNSIPASKILDGTIESIDISEGTISGSKIKDNTIESAKIHDGAITTDKIYNGAVTEDKLHDDAITTAKILDNSVTTAKILNDAVTEDKIHDDAVTADKILNGSVTENKIYDGAVTTNKIYDGAVTTTKIANSTITSTNIAYEAITEDKLADGAVTTAKLADGLISEIQNITDATPTTGSVKPVQSGGVKTAIDNVAFSTNEKVKNVGIDDEPTAGSENLVKSGGVAAVNGSYVENPEWIMAVTDKDGRILCGIKTDGSIEWGVGIPTPIKTYVGEQIASIVNGSSGDDIDGINKIITFLNDFSTSDTLKYLLDTKVDEEEGKTLINSEYANGVHYIENPEFIYAKTDAEGKILLAIKADGSIYYGAGVPPQVIDYIQQKIDEFNLDKCNDIIAFLTPLLEGDKTLQEILGEISEVIPELVEDPEWLQVTIDNERKIIEGIRKSTGEKHISKFDEETEKYIKDVSGTIGNNFTIPQLDSNFTSPVPVTITGDKGNENAKYEFELPLKNSFNIRFEFLITENLLNQEKNAVIAKLNETNIVTTEVSNLVQTTSTAIYNEEEKTNYWPCLIGGISINGSVLDAQHSFNIGNYAFSVKYVGQESVATIENDGTALILTIGQTVTTLPSSTYSTVSALYEQLKTIQDIVVDYRNLENKNTSELAVFSECKLKSTFYTGINGEHTDSVEEYVDAAPFFIPYAVSNQWHRVEIVNINNTLYVVCDGIVQTPQSNIEEKAILTLGGGCGVKFRNFEVHCSSSYDAEVVDGIVISSMNPYIIIYEGHGIDKVPSNEATVQGNMNTTIDRLQTVFERLESKGYIPVSIYDIADYYEGNKNLPKRCYTLIFDDFRFSNVLDIQNRSVFTKFGVKPALAIVTGDFETTDIRHNGNTITPEKAVDITHLYNFDTISHTKSHKDYFNIKPSEVFDSLIEDTYNADIYNVNGDVLVFPYGDTTLYMISSMKWMGYRLGVNVYVTLSRYNSYNWNYLNLTRYEIGMRISLTNIFNGIR